ncbi:MAG TPA: AbrB/MazE/SpoVT family DNA-binding domain-containing protein [Gaiellaceae bacterium]|nr:AbrB/MazE/SpoVT family DNA-binding domain-containing protein [Gaiellaceae bacterium]
MKSYRITSSGQVSIPAEVRRRWGTSMVIYDDLGDRLVVRPVPEDPIAAARGILKGLLPPTEQLRAEARRDEAHAEERKRRLYRR